jgi:hypothetical protein
MSSEDSNEHVGCPDVDRADIVCDRESESAIEAPKKPRTQKQIDAFKKCREKMLQKREEVKKGAEEVIVYKTPAEKPKPKPRRVVVLEEDPLEEEEEEVQEEVVAKPERKPRKPAAPKAKPTPRYEPKRAEFAFHIV